MAALKNYANLLVSPAVTVLKVRFSDRRTGALQSGLRR
jgi:hypothetical protein